MSTDSTPKSAGVVIVVVAREGAMRLADEESDVDDAAIERRDGVE